MKLFKSTRHDRDEEVEKHPPSRKREKVRHEEPKDPYRWVSFLILLVLMFISYLFWADK